MKRYNVVKTSTALMNSNKPQQSYLRILKEKTETGKQSEEWEREERYKEKEN